MHELSKQFLRPSSPSGSQKSSRYKQKENIYYLFATSAVLSVHSAEDVILFIISYNPSSQVQKLHQIKEVKQIKYLNSPIKE